MLPLLSTLSFLIAVTLFLLAAVGATSRIHLGWLGAAFFAFARMIA